MPTKANLFSNRTVFILTKHDKDKVIAPLFENELSLPCKTIRHIDTDVLGTFSGEVDRLLDPIATLREKCNLAQEMEGCELVVATEGSFGNHPSIFFASANDELIMLKDFKNDIEIVERVVSLDTNLYEACIANHQELEDFISKTKFPSHGIIIKAAKDDFVNMSKGITDYKMLLDNFNKLLPINGSCYLETDMRACFNPTRMEVIKQATERLILKIKSQCPQCDTPGYGVIQAIRGLPCKQCHSKTRSIIAHEYGCQKCDFTTKKMYPNNKEYEDPMYCDYCNP